LLAILVRNFQIQVERVKFWATLATRTQLDSFQLVQKNRYDLYW